MTRPNRQGRRRFHKNQRDNLRRRADYLVELASWSFHQDLIASIPFALVGFPVDAFSRAVDELLRLERADD